MESERELGSILGWLPVRFEQWTIFSYGFLIYLFFVPPCSVSLDPAHIAEWRVLPPRRSQRRHLGHFGGRARCMFGITEFFSARGPMTQVASP